MGCERSDYLSDYLLPAPDVRCLMFVAIACGIASALAGGDMSLLFGGGQKAASGGIQGDVIATDNNTVGMGDAGIKPAIKAPNLPNPKQPAPRFVPGPLPKAAQAFIEGTLRPGPSPVPDNCLALVRLAA